MIVQLSAETVKALGAKDPAEAPVKISEALAESTRMQNLMAEQTTNFEALTKRLDAIEAKLASPIITEARISELVSAGAKTALSDWAASEDGKKLIGAEASRITTAAFAAIGTVPAKASPASTEQATVKTFAEVVQGGMSAGQTKSAAIIAGMKSHPKEYQEYLKTGGNL